MRKSGAGRRIPHQTVMAAIAKGSATEQDLTAAHKAVEEGTLKIEQCIPVLQANPDVFRILITGVPSSYATSSDIVGFLHKLRKALERLVRDEVQKITKVRKAGVLE